MFRLILGTIKTFQKYQISSLIKSDILKTIYKLKTITM